MSDPTPTTTATTPRHDLENITRVPTNATDPVCDVPEAAAPAIVGEEDIGPAPDGGLEAWLCILGGLLLMFCVFGFLMSNGQLQSYYLDHQLKGYSKSTVALLGSVQTLIEFLPAFITGRYFDVHGARLLTVLGTTLAFVSTLGMAFSKEYYQFLLSSIGFGLSGAFIYAPCTAVVAHWFLHRRGTALAIMTCGSGIGGIIYPIMLARLLDQTSYRNTLLIIACFNLVLMLPAVVFLKARLPPRQPPPLSALKGPWRDPRYVLLVLGAACFGINLLSPYFNALNVAKSNNVPAELTKYTVAITQAGSVSGRIITGIVSDYVGVWNVFGAVGFISATVMFAFWTPPNIGTAPTILGLIFWGMISGAWFTLVGSATAHISPVQETGMRFGMLISALAIPSFVGPIICGALIIDGKFTYAGLFCGICFIVAGIFTIMSPLWARIQARRSKNRGGGGDREKGAVVDVEDTVRGCAPEQKVHDEGSEGFKPQEPVLVEEAVVAPNLPDAIGGGGQKLEK